MIDNGVCDKGFILSPSNCECECDKLCDIGEYLDYENCERRKKLIDELVEEFTENVDEAKITEITEITENKCKFLCTIYVVIIAIFITICIGIGTYFVYSHWYLKKDVTRVKFGTCTQIAIYWTYKWDKTNK